MSQAYETKTDLKNRFGGILENPHVSKIQRNCLDGFKVTGVKKILSQISFDSLLDLGCGYGEHSRVKDCRYVGIDNSFARVKFAQKKIKNQSFVNADAMKLPFKNNSFEAVLLANTSHHLSNEEFDHCLQEMARVGSKFVIIADATIRDNQNFISSFFYNLDRGANMRKTNDLSSLITEYLKSPIKIEQGFLTFPGIYWHTVYVVEI